MVEFVKSSFFPYLLFTYVLNLPPFIYCIATIFSYNCNLNWLFFNSFLDAIHMMASVYSVHRIGAKKNQDDSSLDGVMVTAPAQDRGGGETPYVQADKHKPTTTLLGGAPNSWDRIRIVLCYDLVMAIYYLIVLVWVIWQCLGLREVILNNHQDKNHVIEEDCRRWVLFSVVYGFLYMGLGVMAWIGSLGYLRYQTTHLQKQHQQQVLAVDENGSVSLA